MLALQEVTKVAIMIKYTLLEILKLDVQNQILPMNLCITHCIQVIIKQDWEKIEGNTRTFWKRWNVISAMVSF